MGWRHYEGLSVDMPCSNSYHSCSSLDTPTNDNSIVNCKNKLQKINQY